FFSSRRRHTRSKRDWSSDVCSSDLVAAAAGLQPNLILLFSKYVIHIFRAFKTLRRKGRKCNKEKDFHFWDFLDLGFRNLIIFHRSEERRVGKECRYVRWR